MPSPAELVRRPLQGLRPDGCLSAGDPVSLDALGHLRGLLREGAVVEVSAAGLRVDGIDVPDFHGGSGRFARDLRMLGGGGAPLRAGAPGGGAGALRPGPPGGCPGGWGWVACVPRPMGAGSTWSSRGRWRPRGGDGGDPLPPGDNGVGAGGGEDPGSRPATPWVASIAGLFDPSPRRPSPSSPPPPPRSFLKNWMPASWRMWRPCWPGTPGGAGSGGGGGHVRPCWAGELPEVPDPEVVEDIEAMLGGNSRRCRMPACWRTSRPCWARSSRRSRIRRWWRISGPCWSGSSPASPLPSGSWIPTSDGHRTRMRDLPGGWFGGRPGSLLAGSPGGVSRRGDRPQAPLLLLSPTPWNAPDGPRGRSGLGPLRRQGGHDPGPVRGQAGGATGVPDTTPGGCGGPGGEPPLRLRGDRGRGELRAQARSWGEPAGQPLLGTGCQLCGSGDHGRGTLRPFRAALGIPGEQALPGLAWPRQDTPVVKPPAAPPPSSPGPAGTRIPSGISWGLGGRGSRPTPSSSSMRMWRGAKGMRSPGRTSWPPPPPPSRKRLRWRRRRWSAGGRRGPGG